MKKYTKYLCLLLFWFFYGGIQSQTYDRAEAIAYAEKWWNGFNTSRAPAEDGGPSENYTDEGGDCAAFVSQCLIAGGLDLSKGSNGYGNGVKEDRVIAGVDEFFSMELSGILYVDIQIFNESNQERFKRQFSVSTDGLIELWNGRYNGKEELTDTYYYILYATDYTGNIEQKRAL